MCIYIYIHIYIYIYIYISMLALLERSGRPRKDDPIRSVFIISNRKTSN